LPVAGHLETIQQQGIQLGEDWHYSGGFALVSRFGAADRHFA
jgi:hypothetical protein